MRNGRFPTPGSTPGSTAGSAGVRLVAAAAGLLLATGCGALGLGGGEKEPPAAGAGTASGGPASGGPGAAGGTAGLPPAKPGGPFTADQLSVALQAQIPRLVETHDITKGRFGGLNVALDAVDPASIPDGVKVSPAKCEPAIWMGPGKQALAAAPAAFVQLGDPDAAKAGKEGVFAWNVLIDAAGKDPKSALGREIEGCSKVRITFEGTTTTLSALKAPRVGTAARGTVFSTSDGSSPKTWIVTYTGNGYIGEVLVQGPTSPAQVTEIATLAARHARQTLGG